MSSQSRQRDSSLMCNGKDHKVRFGRVCSQPWLGPESLALSLSDHDHIS